jgi:hypothetical protein
MPIVRARTSSRGPLVAGTALGLVAGAIACARCGGGRCIVNNNALAPDDGGGAGPKGSSSSKASSASATSGTGGGPEEPDGPTRFTFVNGVVDEPSVSFCFVSYPSGASARAPFPSSGVPFGHAYVAPAASPDIPSSDANILAIAGSIPAGATCGDISADPMGFSDLTVVELGVIPASALSMRRSFLFVTDGCFGGTGHAGPMDAKVCGKDYTSGGGNPGLSVLAMSRISDPAHIGFQYVNAVAAATKLSASLQPGLPGSQSHFLADSVPLGAALPYPPNLALGASDLGPVGSAAVLNIAPPDTTPASVMLGQALSASGLTAANVANGKDLVLIGVGATPGTPSGMWWNDFTVVAVANDPP